MRQYIIQIVKQLVGSEYLYFDTVLLVKKTPHTQPAFIWAVCVSPSDQIYVMNADEEWHQVSEEETLILQSLHQRVRYIQTQSTKPQLAETWN